MDDRDAPRLLRPTHAGIADTPARLPRVGRPWADVPARCLASRVGRPGGSACAHPQRRRTITPTRIVIDDLPTLRGPQPELRQRRGGAARDRLGRCQLRRRVCSATRRRAGDRDGTRGRRRHPRRRHAKPVSQDRGLIDVAHSETLNRPTAAPTPAADRYGQCQVRHQGAIDLRRYPIIYSRWSRTAVSGASRRQPQSLPPKYLIEEAASSTTTTRTLGPAPRRASCLEAACTRQADLTRSSVVDLPFLAHGWSRQGAGRGIKQTSGSVPSAQVVFGQCRYITFGKQATGGRADGSRSPR